MRNLIVAVLAIASTLPSTPVSAGNSDTRTVLLARGGVHVGNFTYRYLEVFQERGRLILPDAGYIDFGNAGHSREFFIGGVASFLIRST